VNIFFVFSGSLDTSILLIVDLIMVSVSIKPLHPLVKLPWPVFIGIGEGRTFRRILNSQMLQFAKAGGKATAYLAERVGLAELTEKHCDELFPTGGAFG
jgi:hypothetical protein